MGHIFFDGPFEQSFQQTSIFKNILQFSKTRHINEFRESKGRLDLLSTRKFMADLERRS